MRSSRLISLIIVFSFVFPSFLPANAIKPEPLANATKSVTLNVSIPGVPAAIFSGNAGGDGFNVAQANGHIYNVFHHDNSVIVNCHDELTSELCDYNSIDWPVVVTSEVGAGMYSSAFINTAETKLYVWAIKRGESAGIQCMNLADASDCGYQVLSTIENEGSTVIIDIGSSEYVDWGSGAQISNRIFAPFAQSDGQTWLACFDLKKELACNETAFEGPALEPGVESFEGSIFNGPHAFAYGQKVYSDYFNYYSSATSVVCWDNATQSLCDGDWPNIGFSTSGFMPILNQLGEVESICSLNMGMGNRCINAQTGENVDIPNYVSEFPTEGQIAAFIGQSLIFGKKVVTIATGIGSIGIISCLDYSTETPILCGFLELPDTSFIYSLNRDPHRPTCVWINADGGDAQITNFDVLTMEQGCSGSLRTSLLQLSTKAEGCDVASWDSVEITSPSNWSSASITVLDQNGEVLPGGDAVEISSANTATSLAGVDFSNVESPYFDFDVQGTDLSEGLEVTFKWHTSTPQICLGKKEVSTTKYTGTSGQLDLGKKFRVSGNVRPSYCGDEIVFTLNRNPLTGQTQQFVLEPGVHETASWKTGKYKITATHPADLYCKTSSESKSLELSYKLKKNQKIDADGWYLNNNLQENFGLSLKTKTTISGAATTNKFSGSVQWQIDGGWKFNGLISGTTKFVDGVIKSGKNVVSEIACPTSPKVGTETSNPHCFVILANGNLSQWDAGSSSWINEQDAQFLIQVFDGGASQKKVKGKIRTINYADFVSFNLVTGADGFDVQKIDTPIKLKGLTGSGFVK